MSYYYPTFTRAEGAAYYRFADMMRKLEWEIHHKFWRGEGLPEAWHEIATDHGPGPKERITLWVDKRTVKFFRATGKGWQTRMNLVLVAYAEARASGAVKGAERFRLDKSAEQREVDGPPPGWGQTKADEEEMAAFFAARDAERSPPEAPEPTPEPIPDPAPEQEARAAGSTVETPHPELAPDPQPAAAAPEGESAPDPEPAPSVTEAVAAPEPPARPMTPQEALRAQYQADRAAHKAKMDAIFAERPGETTEERKQRMIYHFEASKARYVEMKRQRGELKDVDPEWLKPRRR